MGSGRKEFVSFNTDTDSDTNAHSDAQPNFVGLSQTNQPVSKHDVQPWHKSNSYGLGVKRSGDAAYFQR